MKVVRWPECDILESDLYVVDEFWTKTNVGPIMTAFLFPLHQYDNLVLLKNEIDKKKKELSNVESRIYKISRDFSK